MDWMQLRASMTDLNDTDYPARSLRNRALRRVFDGTLYDHIGYPFSMERTEGGQYTTLDQRRPSVRHGWCATVVSDSVAMLFGQGRWPAIAAKDGADTALGGLQAMIAAARLNEVMADAACRGSVGSVAILLRCLSFRPYFDVMDTDFLTPEWQALRPDLLLRVTEKRKVSRDSLIADGYTDLDPGINTFWFQRVWDENEETWFLPFPVKTMDGKPLVPVRDGKRSVTHALGFVPMVWIRNLPGGDDIDGGCTFLAAIDNMIEADYQASQAGRGLKYSADPTLLIKDPATGGVSMEGGAATALIINTEGDAKLLEISGSAAAAVLDYVQHLRKVAFDRIGGDSSDPDKMSSAQSGRAMELMKQGLVWLADRLRASYGDGGLLPLLRMVCDASTKLGGLFCGDERMVLNGAGLSLKWPHFFAPTYDDLNQQAQTLGGLVNAALISRESAVTVVAEAYDIPDVPAELAQIAADEAAQTALLADRAAQTTVQVKESADA